MCSPAAPFRGFGRPLFGRRNADMQAAWEQMANPMRQCNGETGDISPPYGFESQEGHTMLRITTCAKLLAASLVFLAAQPAFAESAAKEITGYYKLTVNFTKNAKKCGFESLEPFERTLRNDLAAVGVKQTDGSIIEIDLEIGGINYGALETQCAIDVSLDFRTTLQSSNIVTDNAAVRRAVDRLQAFPVSLYQVGAFAVETTLYTVADGRNVTRAEARVLDLIHHLVQRFDQQRKK